MTLTANKDKLTALEQRIVVLEQAHKYPQWFIDHWYKTFELPLQQKINDLQAENDFQAKLLSLKTKELLEKQRDNKQKNTYAFLYVYAIGAITSGLSVFIVARFA